MRYSRFGFVIARDGGASAEGKVDDGPSQGWCELLNPEKPERCRVVAQTPSATGEKHAPMSIVRFRQ
jgi:hypothetical protein